MKSYKHLSYDPIDFADELAKLDVMIAEKVKELKQEEREAIDEKETFSTLATDFYERDCGNEERKSQRDKY